jgi:3-hydroxyacyl-CoA dehydrogenase
MGLVEVGVGLIPGGGGTKEMLARTANPQTAFELIGFGKVSTSGPDAQRLGYLRASDGITMNRERLVADAKKAALALAGPGYQPTRPLAAIPVGGPSAYAALALGVHLAHRAGRISDHDAVIGRKLAWILTGGNVPHATTLTEQQLLDLEREAFLSLCGEPRTQERIAYTLKTGKTLRN